MFKKNIAKLLVFAMLLTMLPFTAAAETKAGGTLDQLGEYVTLSDAKVISGGKEYALTKGSGDGKFSTPFELEPATSSTTSSEEGVTVSFTVTVKTDKSRTLCGVYAVNSDTQTEPSTFSGNLATGNTFSKKIEGSAPQSVKYCIVTQPANTAEGGNGENKAEGTLETTYISVKLPEVQDSNATAAPAFASNGETYTMKNATEKEATFTLSAAAPTNTTYKVYSAASGGTAVDGVTATASGTTLTVTLSQAPTGKDPISYYVSATETGKTESTRATVTIYPFNENASAKPAFTADGAAYTMPTADAKEATFTLSAAAAATTVFEVYATAADTKAVEGVTAAADGTTLTLTFTEVPTGNEKITYYISATEQGKDASSRTAVTVQPYVVAKYTIQFVAGEGATGTMADKTVEKAATGTTTYKLPESTFTAPTDKVFDKWTVSDTGLSISEDGTLTIEATVNTETPIKVTASWKNKPSVTTPKYTIQFAAGEGATGTMADKTVEKAATGTTTYELPESTFTAPEGKVFDKWIVSGEDLTISEDGKILTIAAAVDTKTPIKVTATWKVTGTAVAKPAVDTKELEAAGVSPELIEEVTTSASSVETRTEDGKDPLADALNQQKADVDALKESVSEKEKQEAIAELNQLEDVNVSSAADVESVVVSYMNIQIKKYVPADGKLEMDIEPQMMLVLTSKTIAEAVDKNNAKIEVGKNAVKAKAQPKTVKVSAPVKMNLVLPASFVEYVKSVNKKVYAGHKTSKGRFEYRGDLGANGSFSFTNPHGFSPFDFPTDPTSGAWIGDVGYENLSSALEEVKSGNTIYVTNKDETGSTSRTDLTGAEFSIKKAESAEKTDSATSWKGTVTINGTKYTADNNGTITVTKPTTDNDRPSGGGGGGGGSSKPAIKPGDKDKPTTPTTTPGGGVAGFNDVAASAWYADSVKYVVDKGLFGGVGNGNFAPNANMTRAMMWTVLARYMGVNTNTGSNWYEAARTWAMAQNISDGTMADGNVTREQFVTMLWRLSGEPAVETSASFTDNGSISGYAKTAVDWAVAQGILNGYNDGSFRPQGSATRAEVAKMLTVFCQNAENTETPENDEG